MARFCAQPRPRRNRNPTAAGGREGAADVGCARRRRRSEVCQRSCSRASRLRALGSHRQDLGSLVRRAGPQPPGSGFRLPALGLRAPWSKIAGRPEQVYFSQLLLRFISFAFATNICLQIHISISNEEYLTTCHTSHEVQNIIPVTQQIAVSIHVHGNFTHLPGRRCLNSTSPQSHLADRLTTHPECFEFAYRYLTQFGFNVRSQTVFKFPNDSSIHTF